MTPFAKKLIKSALIVVVSFLVALAITQTLLISASYGWDVHTFTAWILMAGVIASLPLVLLWDTDDYSDFHGYDGEEQ